MNKSTFGLTTVLAALAAMPAVSQTEDSLVVPTTLSALRQTPDAFRGVTVAFDVHFASMGSVENPFFTRFTPTDFANFYVWADEQPIWQREAYNQVFGHMFLSKSSDQIDKLYELNLYEHVRLTAVVRNTFMDMPWIEVLSFAGTGNALATPTLAHMYRGEQFMAKRQWQRAISELSLAPTGNLANPVMAAIEANLGTCYLSIGEASKGESHLSSSISYFDQNLEVQRQLRVAKSDPSRALDTSVEAVEIADNQRPMWEAFEAVPMR